jgi:ABC-type multidrug transport system fused ATPase/permease subunit
MEYTLYYLCFHILQHHNIPSRNRILKKLHHLLRIFHLLKPEKGIFAIGFVFLLLSSATALLFPSIMGDLLDAQNATPTVQEDWWNSNSIDSLSLLLLMVFLAQSVFSYFRIYLFSIVTENMLMSLRRRVFNQLISLPMGFFSQRRIGELNSRIAADIALLQETFTTTIAEFIRQLLTIAVGIVLISIYAWQLTVLMLATIPLIALVAVFFGRYIKRLSKQTQSEVAASNVIVEESLTSIASVKAFSNEFVEMNRFAKKTAHVRTAALLGAKWRAAFISFIIFAVFGAIVLVIWKAANLKEEGLLTIGELVKFVLYTVFIGASFAGIPELMAKLQKAIGASEHLLDLLEEKGEQIEESEHGLTSLNINEIAFENVSFCYPSRPETVVLHGISFNVNAGQQLAIVGPSGAGKSTITNLLLRFYTPNEGSIRIDQQNIQDISLNTLRNNMAIVPQEVLLFGGSIQENIAYGKPGSSIEEIRAAAKKANAHEFIEQFPKGYDELVGDRGVQLSGGQRQRIAIARVFLKNPSILILDEATSSLDAESERLVQEALQTLMENRTSFVIAHRLSTIKKADHIFVLDKGHLVEQGTHQQLMQDTQGLYHKLISLQYSA